MDHKSLPISQNLSAFISAVIPHAISYVYLHFQWSTGVVVLECLVIDCECTHIRSRETKVCLRKVRSGRGGG